jgi:microcystin-dependent protein
MPGHYTNTSSIVANSSVVATTLRGVLDNLDDAVYAVETANVLAMPAGSLIPFAGATEPVGWLFCYGQQISRAAYSALFTAIGTTYGVGDGSTTFNLPDLRGRIPLCKDNLGGTSANRVVAAAADTLGGNGGTETHTLTTAEIPAHTHPGIGTTNNSYGGGASGALNGTGGSTGSNAGGGGAHNNMQPYITLAYLIKT